MAVVVAWHGLLWCTFCWAWRVGITIDDNLDFLAKWKRKRSEAWQRMPSSSSLPVALQVQIIVKLRSRSRVLVWDLSQDVYLSFTICKVIVTNTELWMLSGCIEVMIMHPLDLIKTRFQLQNSSLAGAQYTGVRDCARKMYAQVVDNSRLCWYIFISFLK